MRALKNTFRRDMSIAVIYRQGPCRDAQDWLSDGGYLTLGEAWDACPMPSWCSWFLRTTLTNEHYMEFRRVYHRLLTLHPTSDALVRALRARYNPFLAEVRASVVKGF